MVSSGPVFQVGVRDPAVFASGWSDAEVADGLVYRWMEAEHAVLAITSPEPWQVLRVHCHFANAVRRDVQVEVSTVVAAEPSVGALHWLGQGWHHQAIVLDRPVAAGAAMVCLDAIQTWREPGGTRLLSAAFAAISGGSGRRPVRRPRLLVGRRD